MVDLHTLDVNIVYEDLTLDNLNDPTKTETDSALSGSGAAHNSNSFASLSNETQIIEHYLRVRSVLEEHILELDFALLWPIWVFLLEGI